jgi:hypothetical protein
MLCSAASCELSKVGIRYLSVTDHTTDLDVGETDTCCRRPGRVE